MALESLHRLAGNYQSAIRVAPRNAMKRLHQAFETLVRNDPAEEKNRPLARPNPQSALRHGCGEFRVGNGDVCAKGDHYHSLRRDAECLNQLALHLLSVSKDP